MKDYVRSNGRSSGTRGPVHFFLTFALLIAAFPSCSHEEPVQDPDIQPMPAPVISHSTTATTATIAGYKADRNLVFKHDLRKTDANVWEWNPATNVPTLGNLENVQELVCLIPAQNVEEKTLAISPDVDEQLMWDKMSVTEFQTTNKLNFDDVRHRLSKIGVEVDHYNSSDLLYAYYHPGGTFDCLTGEFTELDSRKDTLIYPQKNDAGLYTITFSIVPQTFKKGDNLLRYREVMTNGYCEYYHEMQENTIVLQADQLFHIHPQWNTDWREGEHVKYTVHVDGVELDSSTLQMRPEETATLTATLKPTNADNQKVTWSSSHPSVATVDDSGKITALDSGTTTITVTTDEGGYTATCVVTVYQEVTGVSFDKNEVDVDEGKTIQLTATIAPSNASVKTLKWESSNTAIATVNENGLVTGLKVGETTITVTALDGGKTATCKVHVKGQAPGSTESGSMEGEENKNQEGNAGDLWLTGSGNNGNS